MRLLLIVLSFIFFPNINNSMADTALSTADQQPCATLDPIVVNKPNCAPSEPPVYTVGVQDVLTISVLQPEQILNDVVVSPDGAITFPYIGTVKVKGLTIDQVQQEIQSRLADGYLKYPTVVVSLKESNIRKFYVYGEVNKPGPFPMDENMTVLRAVSLAGGFTRFGSASRVKVLRPKEHAQGYATIPVNITSVMDGNTNDDLQLKSGDIVVVSEGIM